MKQAIKLIALCVVITPFVPAFGLSVATFVFKSWDILTMIGQGVVRAFTF